MEENNYVRNIADLFNPIEGYCIEYVVATTFSLDAVVALALIKYIYDDSVFFSRTKVLNDALTHDKLRIFYQKDKFSSRLCRESNEQIYIDKILSKVCIPVEVEKGYCFHPKITLICFKNDNRYIYRLGIASKNLSLSKMNEVIVVDETEPVEQYRPIADLNDVNKLIDFIKILCFENMHVIFQGKDSKDSISVYEAMELDKVSRMIAISPGFDSTECMFRRRFNSEEIEFWYNESSHTKMYFLEKHDGKNEIWAGSSNCTANGLGFSEHHNYECMARVYTDTKWEGFQEAIKDNGYKRIDINNLPQYEGSEFDSSGLEAFINSITETKMEIQQKNEDSGLYECTLKISSSADEKDIKAVQCIFCGGTVDVENENDNNYKYKCISDGKSVSNIVIFQKKDKNNSLISRSVIADIDKINLDLYNTIFEGIKKKNPIHTDEKLLDEVIKTDLSEKRSGNVNGGGNKTVSASSDDCIYEKLIAACIQNFDRLEDLKKLCNDESIQEKIQAIIVDKSKIED
ncbi:MAG: hypothetical protein K6E34_12300 [Lachnospiraceae bacterium]|nr:hypothetical protein [Lachnospiraceae bacterium]